MTFARMISLLEASLFSFDFSFELITWHLWRFSANRDTPKIFAVFTMPVLLTIAASISERFGCQQILHLGIMVYLAG